MRQDFAQWHTEAESTCTLVFSETGRPHKHFWTISDPISVHTTQLRTHIPRPFTCTGQADVVLNRAGSLLHVYVCMCNRWLLSHSHSLVSITVLSRYIYVFLNIDNLPSISSVYTTILSHTCTCMIFSTTFKFCPTRRRFLKRSTVSDLDVYMCTKG